MEVKVPLLVIKFNYQTLPTMVEKKNIDWVLFGEKNEFPEYLLKLYNECAKHRSLICGKALYTFGKGVSTERFLTTTEKARAQEFINTSEYGEGINSILRKIILDDEIFGGFYTEVIWNKAGTKIASRRHIDYSYIRSNSDNTEFYYTKKWTIKNHDGTYRLNTKVQDEEDFEVYKPFDEEERKGKQLFFYKRYSPSLATYPLPGYIGAIKDIETDVEITNYHYSNLKNGFTATVLINFNNGIPTEKEQEKLEQQIKDKLSGSSNAGKFILSFSDGREKSAEVTVLSMSDADKQFQQLRKDTTQEIFIGHEITNPMLFGIMREEGLGSGRSDIALDNELFQSRYVNNKQQVFTEFVNTMATYSGLAPRFSITKSDPIDLDWFGNEKLFQLLSDDEKRMKAGLPKLQAEAADILTGINSLSPLVANKVLDSMSVDEIRGLVGLASTNGAGITRTTVQSRNDFNKVSIAKKLREKGESGFIYEVIAERPLRYEGFQRQQEKEVEFLQEGFAVIETKIKTIERSVLDLLNKEPDTSVETLAEVLKVTPKSIEKAISSLQKQKLLKGNNTPTVKGGKKLDEKQAETTEIFIRYKYKVRSDVPDKSPIIETSRDFCKELLQDGKLSDGKVGSDLYWSLSDINDLSAQEGYDVFEHTGGFYHNPNTGETTAQCRHEWVETIVTLKG